MLHRLWLACALVVVLGPSLAMMILPGEMWPWTCAPMFAANVDDRVLYRPRVIMERVRGDQPYRPSQIGLSERHFSRLLLIDAYGSAYPNQPYGFVADDNREKFRERLDTFFDKVVDDKLPAARALRLELVRVSDGVVHIVGRYTLSTRTFTLASEQRRGAP